VPTRPVSTLLTTSAYRLSRNPMYTRLAIGYLGAAAVFGLASHETLAEAAALVTGPGRIPAAGGRRAGAAELEPPLFGAFASREETLHANPGHHAAVPAFELDSSERFFIHHLVECGASASAG